MCCVRTPTLQNNGKQARKSKRKLAPPAFQKTSKNYLQKHTYIRTELCTNIRGEKGKRTGEERERVARLPMCFFPIFLYTYGVRTHSLPKNIGRGATNLIDTHDTW